MLGYRENVRALSSFFKTDFGKKCYSGIEIVVEVCFKQPALCCSQWMMNLNQINVTKNDKIQYFWCIPNSFLYRRFCIELNGKWTVNLK